jgi:hypothetical protein
MASHTVLRLQRLRSRDKLAEDGCWSCNPPAVAGTVRSNFAKVGWLCTQSAGNLAELAACTRSASSLAEDRRSAHGPARLVLTEISAVIS